MGEGGRTNVCAFRTGQKIIKAAGISIRRVVIVGQLDLRAGQSCGACTKRTPAGT